MEYSATEIVLFLVLSYIFLSQETNGLGWDVGILFSNQNPFIIEWIWLCPDGTNVLESHIPKPMYQLDFVGCQISTRLSKHVTSMKSMSICRL